MKKTALLYFLPVLLILSACSKDSDKDADNGIAENSWTFTEGSKVFSGSFVFETASLNTGAQANGTYTFTMLGAEKTSGYLFSIALSLLDLNFTTKTYKSGISSDDHLNAFYYTSSPVTPDIYKSSDLDPGPVMDYTITAYDAANDVVTIEFSGQAQLTDGTTHVPITNGKLKVKIDRL